MLGMPGKINSAADIFTPSQERVKKCGARFVRSTLECGGKATALGGWWNREDAQQEMLAQSARARRPLPPKAVAPSPPHSKASRNAASCVSIKRPFDYQNTQKSKSVRSQTYRVRLQTYTNRCFTFSNRSQTNCLRLQTYTNWLFTFCNSRFTFSKRLWTYSKTKNASFHPKPRSATLVPT
jgi:hypothetical protein